MPSYEYVLIFFLNKIFHEQNSETQCGSQGENSPKVDIEVLAVLAVNFSKQQASVVVRKGTADRRRTATRHKVTAHRPSQQSNRKIY
jgi:hypothetical protein